MILLELINGMGLNPKRVANIHGGEFHGECPVCGGKDRFIVQPYRQGTRCVGFYYCRQCDKGGDTVKFCIDILKMDYKDAVQRANATMPASYAHSFKPKNKIEHKETYLVSPKKAWVSKSIAFTEWAHKNLLQHDESLQYLTKRGIPYNAVVRYKLGYNPECIFRKRTDWGLDVEEEGNELVSFPAGIVIPFIEKSGNVTRLKIRRSDYTSDSKFSKYKIIPGSMGGANILGNVDLLIMIVVESELDYFAVHNAVGDIAFVVAVGGSTKNLDNVTADIARTKRYILVCHDNDDAGLKMLEKWQKIYSHAKACPTPIGKDIGEAIEQGLNIREWILGKIPVSLHPVDTPQKTSTEVVAPTLPAETPKEPEPLPVVEVQPQVVNTYIKADEWVMSDRPTIEWWLNLDRSKLAKGDYSQLDAEVALGPTSFAAKLGKLQGQLMKLKKHIDQQ